MESNLKDKIRYFLDNFNPIEINEYFGNGSFIDDCEKYYDNNSPAPIITYLNDAFFYIDMDYRDTDKFSDMVKETLETALKMFNN